MKIADTWWTSPQESESGKLIMVTGRDGVEKAMQTGKYVNRIDVTWQYNSLPDGMPEEEDAKLMEQATDALQAAFDKDPVAIMTGIYTGDGKRDWVFYTKNLRVFGIVFNRALEELPTIPLVVEAYADPDWEEYREMRERTYIADGE